MLISFMQSLHHYWEMVKKSFSTEGILSGLLAIGKVILDAILYPMQQIAQLLYSITGKKYFDNVAKGTEFVRKSLMEESPVPIVNPKATEQQNLMQMMQGNIGVDFNNVPIGTKITSSTPNIMPKVNSTQDAGFYLRSSY